MSGVGLKGIEHAERVDGQPSEKPDMEELERICGEQLADYRQRWLDLSARAGKGIHLWHEKGWEWEEPDWDADPETWPPMAKVLWLYVRMRLTEERLQYAAHFIDCPGWCQQCTGEADLPKGWHVSVCPEHSALVGMTQNLAAHLGFREAR